VDASGPQIGVELRQAPVWEPLVREKSARNERVDRLRRRRLRLRVAAITTGVILVILGYPFILWETQFRVSGTHTPIPSAWSFLIGILPVLAGGMSLGAAGLNRFGKPIEALDTDIE